MQSMNQHVSPKSSILVTQDPVPSLSHPARRLLVQERVEEDGNLAAALGHRAVEMLVIAPKDHAGFFVEAASGHIVRLALDPNRAETNLTRPSLDCVEQPQRIAAASHAGIESDKIQHDHPVPVFGRDGVSVHPAVLGPEDKNSLVQAIAALDLLLVEAKVLDSLGYWPCLKGQVIFQLADGLGNFSPNREAKVQPCDIFLC